LSVKVLKRKARSFVALLIVFSIVLMLQAMPVEQTLVQEMPVEQTLVQEMPVEQTLV